MKMTLYDLLRHNKKYDSFSELMIHVYSKKTHWYTKTIWWWWFFSSEFLNFLTTDIIFNTSIFPQDFFPKWKWQLNNNSLWFFLPKGIFLIIYHNLRELFVNFSECLNRSIISENISFPFLKIFHWNTKKKIYTPRTH